MSTAALGGWASSSDPLVVEVLARAGFDFVGLDLQHGGSDYADAARCLQILELLQVRSLVRLSSEEIAAVPRYLDAGAGGIIVATVDDVATAERAVALARYQPVGRRSYGGSRFGFGREPEDLDAVRPEVWVMIETLAGLRNVAAIAQVPGLFGIAVGPADLARALGLHPAGRAADASWNTAVDTILATARERGLATCQFAGDGAEARRWFERGFDHVVLSNDLDLLRAAARDQIHEARRSEP